jgi:hypothetical protein
MHAWRRCGHLRMPCGSLLPRSSSGKSRAMSMPLCSQSSRSEFVGRWAVWARVASVSWLSGSCRRSARSWCWCRLTGRSAMGLKRRANWPRRAQAVVRAEAGRSRGCVVIQERARRLEIMSWLLAWRRYALAAAILGQMSFSQAVEHEAVVTEVCRMVCVSLW